MSNTANSLQCQQNLKIMLNGDLTIRPTYLPLFPLEYLVKEIIRDVTTECMSLVGKAVSFHFLIKWCFVLSLVVSFRDTLSKKVT